MEMSGLLTFQGVIRPLLTEDMMSFYEHLLRLDEQSRHDRFSGGVSDAALMRYASQAMKAEGFILGFFIAGILRGAVEIRYIGTMGELATSVEHDYQHGGIGTALMGRSLDMARKAGMKQMHLNFIPHNHAMQQLAKHYGADFHHSKDDVEADFLLAA
jgi:GNAT superfamily N-acetyltransferase